MLPRTSNTARQATAMPIQVPGAVRKSAQPRCSQR